MVGRGRGASADRLAAFGDTLLGVITTSTINTPVRLIFTMGWDPLQLLINIGTRSAAAHVAIGLGDAGSHILHAYEPGITLEPREDYLLKRQQILVAEYEIVPDVAPGLTEALSRIGQRGFAIGAFQIGVIRLLRMACSPLYKAGVSNEQTCARFAMLLDPTGERIPEWRGIARRDVVPGDLLAAAQTGPSFRQLSTAS